MEREKIEQKCLGCGEDYFEIIHKLKKTESEGYFKDTIIIRSIYYRCINCGKVISFGEIFTSIIRN